MTREEFTDELSIYVPRGKSETQSVERMIQLRKKKDCSVNYVIVEATIECLKKEEVGT